MPRLTNLVMQFVMVGALLTLAGCQSARVENPIDPSIISSQDDNDQMTFWHELATKQMVANDEAFHAILLFVDGKDNSEGYTQRVETLKSRKMLPGYFNADADQAITRGNLAVALVGALDIKGGVMLRLTGANARYATRELMYEGIYPDSSEHQTFTGQQFVGIIGKAEDYQRQFQEKLQTPAVTPEADTPEEVTPAPAPTPDAETQAPATDMEQPVTPEPVVPADEPAAETQMNE